VTASLVKKLLVPEMRAVTKAKMIAKLSFVMRRRINELIEVEFGIL
jgi:hypothetical protein